MSRIRLALDIVDGLRQLAGSLESLVKVIESDDKTSAVVEGSKDEPTAIETVRAVLAEKSQSGKQPEVKALITKYGAKKLTDVDPAFYRELLAEAEVL